MKDGHQYWSATRFLQLETNVSKSATLLIYLILKKPSKEAQNLQNKLIYKHNKNFTGKSGRSHRLNVKPISLHIDKEKLAAHNPTSHIKPYDVPFHLRQAFESELLNMIDAGIVEQCETLTMFNTEAFPVPKSDPSKCRIVGYFHGLNSVLQKVQ